MEKIFDCIILGGGPAGMSAGIYCARGNLNCAILDISMFGGAPVNYLEIENYPGFKEIEGWELSEKLEEHLDKFNVQKFPAVEIKSVDLVSPVKKISLLDGKEFLAHSIIIACLDENYDTLHGLILGLKHIGKNIRSVRFYTREIVSLVQDQIDWDI